MGNAEYMGIVYRKLSNHEISRSRIRSRPRRLCYRQPGLAVLQSSIRQELQRRRGATTIRHFQGELGLHRPTQRRPQARQGVLHRRRQLVCRPHQCRVPKHAPRRDGRGPTGPTQLPVPPSSSWSIAAARITPPSDHTTTWPVTEVGSTTLSTMSCRLATLMATITTHTSLALPRRPATASPKSPTPSAPSPTAVPPPRTPNPNSPPLSLKLALSVLLLTPAELASSSTAAEFT